MRNRTASISRVLACGLVLLAAAPLAQVPFASVAKGDASGQQVARQVTVRTAAEWTALWKDHAPGDMPPEVDFARNMVVGVFLGTRPSVGYEVEIAAVRVDAQELIVEYAQRQPAPGTMAAQILTQPFHLVSLPRHQGTVRFSPAPRPAAQ